ncbi:MAG: hypothetical protein RRY36_08120 [Bacteroidaceae bacterium]
MRFIKKEIQQPKFTSKSSAFDFMFAISLAKGEDPLIAAEKSESFATIVAKNKCLPDVDQVEKQGIEKAFVYLKQIVAIKKEHPDVWELGSAAIGGVLGAVVGTKAEETHEPKQPKENIDFNNLS